MDPKQDPSTFRLYSAARMKRRANLSEENRSQNEIRTVSGITQKPNIVAQPDERISEKSRRKDSPSHDNTQANFVAHPEGKISEKSQRDFSAGPGGAQANIIAHPEGKPSETIQREYSTNRDNVQANTAAEGKTSEKSYRDYSAGPSKVVAQPEGKTGEKSHRKYSVGSNKMQANTLEQTEGKPSEKSYRDYSAGPTRVPTNIVAQPEEKTLRKNPQKSFTGVDTLQASSLAEPEEKPVRKARKSFVSPDYGPDNLSEADGKASRRTQRKYSVNPEAFQTRKTYSKKYSMVKSPTFILPKEATKSSPVQTASVTSLLDELSDSASESNESFTLEQIYAPGDSKYVSDQVQELEKLKILATLLPDEILRDPRSRKPRSYPTALMFSDVSGFTQLCEKFDKTGMGGPSRLTEILNEYIGSMIKVVLSKNGDVCKFGGDAFLCAWKVTEETDLEEVVHMAIETAIEIQKNYGKYKVDVGVTLSVKIAVSAGKAYFSIIGSNNRKQYVIVGAPVMEVRDAEQISKAGDVIVTLSAWQYVKNNMYYSFTYFSNNNYIKVHDFGPSWKSAKETFKSKRAGLLLEDLRPLLKFTSRMKIEEIRPFILPPVMRNLDFNRPLEYLTEMRQIAIVFFNIVPDFVSLAAEDIITLSDAAVQIVSEAVSRSGGVTNKLTLFDKDMVILTVFGLKGFKHDLASQVALKCAYSCLKILKKLKNVISVSAGVTTGMAYCGVIGHILRREYTVMGHPVNMAARLMCSYRNIVSCDRNTFLHSKLESDYFQVLEYQYMKGIQSLGPFYKFTLDLQKKKAKTNYEAYPILGREKEIKEFELFLMNSVKSKEAPNFMIILGKARMGKSRLVAKLINKAENISSDFAKVKKLPLLEICVIPLTENYFKISYSGFRLIFQSLLGLGDSSSKEEWKDRILSKLGDPKYFHLLASLNSVFQINFALQPQYLAMNYQEQADAQMALIRDLYYNCNPKAEKWLIVIEDAEFIDEESWKLLKWFSHHSDKTIYLLTIGQRLRLSNTALDCIEHVGPTKITLTEIDKWYYSALACQILGVKAIPVELENLLQNYRSSGNPGWLESFLLSLKQSGSIHVRQATVQEIKSLGLVIVPDFMLEVTETEDRKDLSNWKNYLETFEAMTDEGKYSFPVCVLGKNFQSSTTAETELTMDVMLLKTFDTLNPLQQLILKIGSVLGNNIKRNALMFVIHREMDVTERPFAKAIKYLFEIKILICAKGNLAQTNLLVPRKMILTSSMKKEVTCECTGLIIPASCRDYPKYASCGYMQFRFPTFRDTVYNLLLDEQKKKFHSSCIEFLRKNTSKCSACNNVPITNVLGYEENNKVILACTVTPIHGVRSTKLEPRPADLEKNQKKNIKKKDSSHKTRSNSPKNSLFVKRESDLVSITERGDCQCAEILSSVYVVLLDHAAGSGRKDIKLEVQLEYASVTLTIHNIPLTMQILEEALTLINEMKEEGDHPEICTPYVYSKIYALMGATKLGLGRLDDSLDLLKTSLKYLKTSYPRTEFLIKIWTHSEVSKLRMKTRFHEKMIGKASDKVAHYKDLLSECFAMISIVHMYMQKPIVAKYASLRALNNALDSNRNFFGLCTAYRTMIDVAFLNNDMKACSKLELPAISVCKRCANTPIEIYEWEAICQLYTTIFQTRHVRAEIEDAVVIGFQSIRIASVIRNTNLKLGLIPDMIFALIQLNRLSEAVTLLRELEFMSKLDTDKSSRLWYYTLCLDFQMYTGFMIVPYEVCENFLKDEDDMSLVRDPDAKYRLYTSLWLWFPPADEMDPSELWREGGFLLPQGKWLEKMVIRGETREKQLKGLDPFLLYQDGRTCSFPEEGFPEKKRYSSCGENALRAICHFFNDLQAVLHSECVRTNEWELSKSHGKTLESYDILSCRETSCNVFTRLKRLEGLLIALVHRMDLRSIYTINKLYAEIHALMNRLEKDVKIVKLFQPRYRVLKCYYNQIRYRDDNYSNKLKHAQNAAELMKDQNLCNWIEHLKMVWSQAISLFQRDFWIEHSNRNQLEWHETEETEKKAVMYSLPLPKF